MSFAELLLSILVATERESEKIKRGEMDVEVDVRERERESKNPFLYRVERRRKQARRVCANDQSPVVSISPG